MVAEMRIRVVDRKCIQVYTARIAVWRIKQERPPEPAFINCVGGEVELPSVIEGPLLVRVREWRYHFQEFAIRKNRDSRTVVLVEDGLMWEPPPEEPLEPQGNVVLEFLADLVGLRGLFRVRG